MEYLIIAQDGSRWNQDPICKQMLQTISLFSIDPRPKVRKKAVEATAHALSNPPPPSLVHPATVIAIDFSIQVLQHYKSSSKNSDLEQQTLLIFMFLKKTMPIFACQASNSKVLVKLDSLISTMLSFPTSGGNTVMTRGVFQVLECVLTLESPIKFPLLLSLLSRLEEMKPYHNDSLLLPAWLHVMSLAFKRISTLAYDIEIRLDQVEMDVEEFFNSGKYGKKVEYFFTAIHTGLLGNPEIKPIIRQEACQTLSILARECISQNMIQEALNSFEASSLGSMLKLLNTSLADILYRDSWGHILTIAGSFFNVFYIFKLGSF